MHFAWNNNTYCENTSGRDVFTARADRKKNREGGCFPTDGTKCFPSNPDTNLKTSGNTGQSTLETVPTNLNSFLFFFFWKENKPDNWANTLDSTLNDWSVTTRVQALNDPTNQVRTPIFVFSCPKTNMSCNEQLALFICSDTHTEKAKKGRKERIVWMRWDPGCIHWRWVSQWSSLHFIYRYISLGQHTSDPIGCVLRKITVTASCSVNKLYISHSFWPHLSINSNWNRLTWSSHPKSQS